MSKKKALLVGINYPGTAHALRGCVNDVLEMESILAGHYGFKDITMLRDHEATTKTMKTELENLVAGAQPGDILFFHYSGHGSQMIDSKYDRDEEPDGLDEILCPIDLNWNDKVIRDDDLREIFDKVPSGVHLTVVLDCCHSGSGLDQANTFQPLGQGEARGMLTEVLAGQGIKDIASRYLPPPPEVTMVAETRRLDFYKPRSIQKREVNQTGLLISGCQAHQTSADAYIGGKYMGACTYMIASALKGKKWDTDYKSLVVEINNKLADAGFSQRPELNGSEALFTKKFLREPETTEDDRPNRIKLCKWCNQPKRHCTCPKWWKQWYWKHGWKFWKYWGKR